jgi:hypothetical protein
MNRPRRNVVVVLLPDEWDRLVRAAISADRDPYAHARFLVRRGLEVDEARPIDRAEEVTAEVA